MECYCYLRNIQDRLSDGKTLYERRFGEPFLCDPSSYLVHWLSITLSLRKISQESTIWKESFTGIVPRIRSLRGENLEG